MRLVTPPGVFAPISDSRLLAAHLMAERPDARTRVLDLCTGSGYLAVAAAQAGAGDVTAVDLSRRAVLSARVNARLNGVRVRALRGDLLEPVRGERFDLIVANPPYVPAADDGLRARGPARAWAAGRDGRALLDQVLAQAPSALAPGGSLLVVHSSVCGEDPTLDRLRAAGLGVEVLERVRGPLGPLMRERVDMLVARGLLSGGARGEEEVLVIAGRAGRASVEADGARGGDPHPAHAQGLRA
jgi:release factor glutamine methyltransferase